MFESGRRNIFVNQSQPIFLKIKATLSLKKRVVVGVASI